MLKNDLTPQQEYWLNRILREYGRKIYFLIILFFILMFAFVVFSANNQSPTKRYELKINNFNSSSTSTSSEVNIEIGGSTTNQTETYISN